MISAECGADMKLEMAHINVKLQKNNCNKATTAAKVTHQKKLKIRSMPQKIIPPTLPKIQNTTPTQPTKNKGGES